MPVRPEARDNLLSLYVQLSSSRGAAMPAQALRQQFGSGIDRLVEVGAMYRGRPLAVLTCPACYEDHPTEVEYDAKRGRSWVFCPEAGREWVEDAKLATLHLTTNWLPDQLARALQVAPSPPQRELIPGAAWLLGDTVVGSTKVSVALVVGISAAGEMDRLIAGLSRRKVLDVGLLLVAGCQLPDYVGAGSRYSAVALDEVSVLMEGSIRIEQDRLSAWIRGLLQGQKRPVRPYTGRPPKEAQIQHLFHIRRDRGHQYVSKLSEAKAIRNEWRSTYPDEPTPGNSTMRRHLPDPEKFNAIAGPVLHPGADS